MLPANHWLQWTERIHASNQAKLRMSYPIREGAYLDDICVFMPLSCPISCRCRALGNNGVWSLRPDVTYARLEHHYSKLFVKGIPRRNWVGPQNGAPAAFLFDQLEARWGNWLDGHSFPEIAHSIQRTIFCTDAFERAAPFLNQIQRFGGTHGTHHAHDRNGVYRSKLSAIAIPDLVIPYDGNSARLQRQYGYSPQALGRGRLATDLAGFLQRTEQSIPTMRHSDDALALWSTRPTAYEEGTCLSRPIDKQWYGHGP